MSKLTKEQFFSVIYNLEKIEDTDNIWVAVGILERMYNDDIGYIDNYFHNYWENRDIEDLSKGIIWCLDNNKDGILSRNARKKVLENYTPEAVGKQYAELYSSLMKQYDS